MLKSQIQVLYFAFVWQDAFNMVKIFMKGNSRLFVVQVNLSIKNYNITSVERVHKYIQSKFFFNSKLYQVISFGTGRGE